MGFKELYYKIEDKYYALLDKINSKIPIHKLTDKIDKIMPSMVFFFLFFLVIIGLIIWLICTLVSTPTITFEFYLDGSLVQGSFTANLTSDGFSKDFTVSDGILKVKFDKGKFVTVKVKEPYNFTKTYKIDSDKIKVDLPKLEVAALKEPPKVKEIDVYLVERNGSYIKDQGTIRVSCEGFEKEFTISGSKKIEVPEQCSYLDIVANVSGYLEAKTSCNTSLCKVWMDKKGTTSPVTIIQNFPKNKVVVYVNDSQGAALKDMNVKITDLDNVSNVIDSGKTNDFGSCTFDEITVGKYKLYVSDPSGVLVTYSQDLEVTAGTPVIVNVIMAKPLLGYFKVKVKTEDSNGFAMATLYVKDFNDNCLDTRDINTGQEYKIGVYEKKKYIFTVTPSSGYDANYGIIEKEEEYNLESGDKSVEIVLPKLKYYNNSQINLQVVKEKEDSSEEPLPGQIITVEHASGTKKGLSLEIGKKVTDANGKVSIVIPNGDYIIKSDSYFYHGEVAVQTCDNPAATAMPQVDAKIVVKAGKAYLNVSVVDEDGKKLENVRVDVYVDSNNYGFMMLGSEDSKEISVEAYHKVYFKAHKDGYLDYISQEIVLQKDQHFTQKVVMYDKLKYLDKAPEIKFIGAYKDLELEKEIDMISNKTEFYYGFDLIVPEFSAEGERIESVTLYGIAGDKNKPISQSDLVLKNVYGFGNEHLYSEFKKDSNFAKLSEEDYTYNAKWFSEKFSGSSYVTRIIVHLKATEVAKDGEALYYFYALDYKAGSNIEYLPEKSTNFLDKTYEIIKFLNKKTLCAETVCLDTFVDGVNTSSLEGGSVNEVKLVPGKQNKVSVILTKGSKGPSLEKNKFSVFNEEVNFNKGLSEAKNLIADLKDISLVLNKITSKEYLTGFNPAPPVFIKEKEIKGYSKNTSLKLDSNISLLEAKNSRLYFYFDKDGEKVVEHVDLKYINNDKPLEIEGLPEALIPMCENKLDLVIKNEGDKIAGAEVKIYYFDGIKFMLDKTYTSNKDGKVKATINTDKDGDQVMISVQKEGYLPNKVILDVTNNLFEYDESETEAKVVYPRDTSPVSAHWGLKNKTDTTFEIKQVEFLGPSSLERFFDVKAMEAYFEDTKYLYPKAEKLNFVLNYKVSAVHALSEAVTIGKDGDLVAVLHLSPKSGGKSKEGAQGKSETGSKNKSETKSKEDSSYEIIYEIPFEIEITFDNTPVDEKCISAELTSDLEVGGSDKYDAVFLEGKSPELYLVIGNWCTLELGGGQASVLDYEFEELELVAELEPKASFAQGSFQVDLTGVSGSEDIGKETYSLFGVDTKEHIFLDAPRKRQQGKYVYKITFIKDPDSDLGDADTEVTFTLKPKYKSGGTLKELSEKPQVTINVSEKTISECLYFGLTEDERNNDKYYLVENSNILRFGYERREGYDSGPVFKGELDNIDKDIRIKSWEDYFVTEMDLVLENNCGVDLKVKVCDEHSKDLKYCKINGEYLDPEFNKEKFNKEKKLKPGEELKLKIRRPQNFSGAIVLPVSVYDEKQKKFVFVKSVKIAVQSSEKNPYFVMNPFINDDDGKGSATVYFNELFPSKFSKWQDKFQFNMVKGEHAGLIPDRERRYMVLYSSSPSKEYLGAVKLSYDPHTHTGQVNNFYEKLIAMRDVLKYKDEEVHILSPNWYLMAGTLLKHKEDWSTGDEESTTGQYWIWSEGVPLDGNIRNKYNFDTLRGEVDILSETPKDPKFFNFYSQILDMSPHIEGPYFVNVAIASVEGDSGGWQTVYSYTFCPKGFEPVRLELHRYEKGDADGRENNLYFKETGGVKSFIYGGYVNLDDDGQNDNSDTAYAQLLICRRSGPGLNLYKTEEIYDFNKGDTLYVSSSRAQAIQKDLVDLLDKNYKEQKLDLEQEVWKYVGNSASGSGCKVDKEGYKRSDFSSYYGELSDCLDSLEESKDEYLKAKEYLDLSWDLYSNIFLDEYKQDALETLNSAIENKSQEQIETQEEIETSDINILTPKGYLHKRLNEIDEDNQLEEEVFTYEYIEIGKEKEKLGEIRLYREEENVAPFSFAQDITKCPYGGITGLGVKPTLVYTWNKETVGKNFCVVKDWDIAGTNACDVVQFARMVNAMCTGGKCSAKKSFEVKLMYDNYSEDSINAMNLAFFENFGDIKILNYDDTPVGVLNPGIYHVDIIEKDDVLFVYIANITSFTPEHIFYYMPGDKLTTAVTGIGISTNAPLPYNNNGMFFLDTNAATPLRAYTVKNYDFKTLNTTKKGVVFAGFFKDSLLYWNNNGLSAVVLTVNLSKIDKNTIELDFTGSPYALELPEVLKSGWVYKKGKKYYAAGNAGFKFEVVEDPEGKKKLKISNSKPLEEISKGQGIEKIQRIIYWPGETPNIFFQLAIPGHAQKEKSETSEKVKSKKLNLKVSSLEDIYKGIEDETICYKSLEGGSEYYYSPIKVLEQANKQ